MSFWTWLAGSPDDDSVVPNENGPNDHNPGDPDGLEIVESDEVETRGMAFPVPSAWDGWPTEWATPDWQQQSSFNRLVDIAWCCLDLNSTVISSMPIYKLRDGQIIQPSAWMLNPDPDIYTSWQEFAKQLFWDFQMGEVFILPMGTSEGYPSKFRVIPPMMINVEMRGTQRIYSLGSLDVTDEILHIRYSSTTTDARGHGPLEMAGARTTAIKLLQRYANNLAETGGIPQYWIGVDRKLTKGEGQDLLDTWIETRTKYAGQPAILGSNATLNQANSMSARDLSLLELSQFNESRIAVMHGVPPFLVGLAGASGSLTYSNIADLFDFHDRSSLRPKVRMVMEAISGWGLPRGTSAELNRDDYTRLPFDKRMAAYKTAIELGILTADEVRIMERFHGSGPVQAAQALTGGTD